MLRNTLCNHSGSVCTNSPFFRKYVLIENGLWPKKSEKWDLGAFIWDDQRGVEFAHGQFSLFIQTIASGARDDEG